MHHDGAEGTADGKRTGCKNGIPSKGSGPAPYFGRRGYYGSGEKDFGGSGPGARSSRHPAAYSLGRLIYADEIATGSGRDPPRPLSPRPSMTSRASIPPARARSSGAQPAWPARARPVRSRPGLAPPASSPRGAARPSLCDPSACGPTYRRRHPTRKPSGSGHRSPPLIRHRRIGMEQPGLAQFRPQRRRDRMPQQAEIGAEFVGVARPRYDGGDGRMGERELQRGSRQRHGVRIAHRRDRLDPLDDGGRGRGVIPRIAAGEDAGIERPADDDRAVVSPS